MLMGRILLIIGNPKTFSLSHALAAAYARGADAARAEVRTLDLSHLDFDPILRMGYQEEQPLEPDLLAAQADIEWADQLVFFYPSWWGNAPALLKGFVDRVFLPGFAFKYGESAAKWQRFLQGRGGRIVLTMDAPRIFNWLMYGDANLRWLRRATLWFCGVWPVRTTIFDQVRFADEKKVQGWLRKMEETGRQDAKRLSHRRTGPPARSEVTAG